MFTIFILLKSLAETFLLGHINSCFVLLCCYVGNANDLCATLYASVICANCVRTSFRYSSKPLDYCHFQ